MRSFHHILIGCTLLVLIPSSAAPADPKQDNRVIADRWSVLAGGFLADLNTEAQVGFGGVLGSLVDLENVLDMDDNKSVARLDGLFRFNRKHAMEIGLLEIGRRSSGSLSEDIEFRDLTFVGNFESEFDMSLLKLGYRYSFSDDGRLNAGFSTGLSTFRFGLELSGDVEVIDPNGGGTTISGDGSEATVTAPIPFLGVFIDYAFTPKLVMRIKPEFFDLEVGDFEGRFIETRWTLDWYFSRHVGIGGGYNSTDLQFSDTGDSPFNVDYRYSGLLIYLSFVGGAVGGPAGGP